MAPETAGPPHPFEAGRRVKAKLPRAAWAIREVRAPYGHLKGYAVTPETAAKIGSASRILTDAMEKLITFGDGGAELIKAAAREIDESQRVASGAG